MSYDLDIIRKRRSTLEGRAKLLFTNAKDRARTKGYECSITEEWVLEKLRLGRCEATGLLFNLYQGEGQGNGRAWGPSLDRVDNTHGYTLVWQQINLPEPTPLQYDICHYSYSMVPKKLCVEAFVVSASHSSPQPMSVGCC
jgi:hypothetical protein